MTKFRMGYVTQYKSVQIDGIPYHVKDLEVPVV